ncbi:MAG: hypothetical protein QNK97_04400 [Gammaproteobacteria bacterium]|jgi:hypothetical protein|tara:strand:+ start:880 stop:1251 length:372 start_codon:yes stop_codon:yes gene_type:complete
MKDNELIAEFMEVDGFLSLSKMEYHISWNWLMPVVEKIESDERYDVDILQYGTRIREGKKDIVNNIADISFYNKIDHTYDAVVKFIKQEERIKPNTGKIDEDQNHIMGGVDFSESINQLNNLL